MQRKHNKIAVMGAGITDLNEADASKSRLNLTSQFTTLLSYFSTKVCKLARSRTDNKKAHISVSLSMLVARTGIEPVTRGFSIQGNLYTITK